MPLDREGRPGRVGTSTRGVRASPIYRSSYLPTYRPGLATYRLQLASGTSTTDYGRIRTVRAGGTFHSYGTIDS